MVSVRPNPSASGFTLQVDESQSPLQLTVTDMLGRMVEQKNMASGQVIRFGQQYQQGIYFIEVNNGTERKVIRLIKTAE